MESKANNLQGRALRSQLQQLVQLVEIFVMLVFIALHVLICSCIASNYIVAFDLGHKKQVCHVTPQWSCP